MKKTDKTTKVKSSFDGRQITLMSIFVIVTIACLASIILMTTKNKENEEFKIDGIDMIKNSELLKDKEFDGLKVINQVLYNTNGMTNYSAILKNDSGSEREINNLYVLFTFEDQEIKLLAIRKTKLENGATFSIDLSFDIDISDVKKIDYVFDE